MSGKDIQGLTAKQVKARRKQDGFNELPDREKKNLLQILFEIVREPMIFLLIMVVVVYYLLGDRTEAIVLTCSVFAIFMIELYQNHKTEKALEALRGFASPSCTVIRDGEHSKIPSRELVVGDMVLVAEGERVPADAMLVSAENIRADESILTGESVPVDKREVEDSLTKEATVYSGTMIVKGHGIAEVIATGIKTQIGEIGHSLDTIKSEKTLLQKEVGRVVKVVAIGAVIACVILALSYWLLRGDLLHGFLAGLTLSIAILPEEFPVVLTVFMALGAWRMARKNVLTRKSQTIETLGSASVLCTDKTGTLTKNIMSIDSITDASGVQVDSVSSVYADVVTYGVLASQMQPFDPMEEAFITAGGQQEGGVDAMYDNCTIVKEYPLEEHSFSVAHVWANAEGVQRFVGLKGAPETVFELCGLTKSQTEKLQKRVAELAGNGLRVLAVAKGVPRKDIPKQRNGYSYQLLGLVALADPIRPEATEAVALCHQAGIRVVMITGDYAETARRIGAEIGLDAGEVMTGEAFAKMTDHERDEAIKNISIFSRVKPAQKLLIVNALKDNGEVVAMTGDGVNDAPALKSAHIGISMGKRGTDVAREASSIVLLDDNFASIVQGVRLGRRIFTNLQKAMVYILIVHMPIIVLSLVPVFFGWSLVLLPIHIVFIEFIIDPSCTLIFEGEPEEKDSMKRKPRPLGAPLFSKRMLLVSIMTGGFVSLMIVLGHWWMLEQGWSEDKARALTFLMVILTNVMMILSISGRRVVQHAFGDGKINAMVIVVVAVAVVMTLVYTIAPIRGLFHFAPITIVEVAFALLASACIGLIIVPIRKFVKQKLGFTG